LEDFSSHSKRNFRSTGIITDINYITVMWISDILVRIRGCVALTYGSRFGSGSGSCFFRQQLIRCQQKIFFSPKLFAYYFLKVHLQQASKIKRQKEVKNRIKQSKGFLTFLLVDGRIQIRIRINTNRSGRPKNIWILRDIWIHNTDYTTSPHY
jgi:hypothetical protein